MDILVATGNKNKIRELSQIMPEHRFLTPKDLNIEYDYDETGTTYCENALGKALCLHKMVGKPVLAEDSGLSVPALNGDPGIYSARYGMQEGLKLNDAEKNAYLLKNMEGIKDRKAFFVCSMVLVMNEYRYFVAQETMEGEIAFQPAGENGFGYDPVLYIPASGKTVAQMSDDEKNVLSHRGKAGRKMKLIIESLAKELD